MALYNFQKRFAVAVASGMKTQTIRGLRNRRTKVGETVHLYSGLRQKGARKLGTGVCTKVEQITIEMDSSRCPKVVIDDALLFHAGRERLAKADGFGSFEDMLAFWDGRLPFEGEIIHWRLEVAK